MKPMSLAQRPRWEVEEGPCRRLHHIVCINCEPEVVEVRAILRAGCGADEVHCVRCLRAKALEERRLVEHGAERSERSGSGSGHGWVVGLHNMLRAVLTFLYDANTASVFSFHSYRAGLATALHAANVPDDMIQLICRWMCPESLHRYRIMGLREHEQYINQAVDLNVDSIQASNVPKVANNEGFARMLSELVEANSQSARQLAHQFDEACTVASDTSAAHASLKRSLPERTQPVPTHPVSLTPATSLGVGLSVVVSAAAWPTWKCTEFSGQGWSATVKRVAKHASRVSFDEARTRDGRRYADAMVPNFHLQVPV